MWFRMIHWHRVMFLLVKDSCDFRATGNGGRWVSWILMVLEKRRWALSGVSRGRDLNSQNHKPRFDGYYLLSCMMFGLFGVRWILRSWTSSLPSAKRRAALGLMLNYWLTQLFRQAGMRHWSSWSSRPACSEYNLLETRSSGKPEVFHFELPSNASSAIVPISTGIRRAIMALHARVICFPGFHLACDSRLLILELTFPQVLLEGFETA